MKKFIRPLLHLFAIGLTAFLTSLAVVGLIIGVMEVFNILLFTSIVIAVTTVSIIELDR